MIPVTTFAGKTVAVFGLGGSGLATCHALIAGGADVIAFDDDAKKVAQAAEAKVGTADLREIDWSTVAALDPHAGRAADASRAALVGEARARGGRRDHRRCRTVLPRAAARMRRTRRSSPITGTNGKSTTTALIAHLLRHAGRDVQMGGNIGVPVLQLEPPAPQRHYVIECSSYQIDLAPSIDPTIGIMLNVTPDHIDRHGTIEHYAAVKSRILGRAKVRIIGVDDDYGRGMAKNLTPCSGRSFRSRSSRSFRTAMSAASATSTAPARAKPRTLPTSPASARCAAATTCRTRSRPLPPARRSASTTRLLQEGLRTFPGLAHRMEEIGRKGAVLFINDSKATNADSAAKALASFDNIYWIAGGLPKEGGIAGLAEFFPRIAKAYLIGEAAQDFAETLDGRVPHEIAGTLDVAVATRRARRGGSRQAGGRAAVAGLRLVRPVPEFRGAGKPVPGLGAGAAGLAASSRVRCRTSLIKPKPRQVRVRLRGPS